MKYRKKEGSNCGKEEELEGDIQTGGHSEEDYLQEEEG